MPQLHKYKCLNTACPGTGKLHDTGLFLAFNNSAECPSCGSMKIEDWGEEAYGKPGPYRMNVASPGGQPGAGQRIDARLDALASAHGLTDINNAGGRAAKAKSAPVQAEGQYGNFTMAGVTVPINDPRTSPIVTGSGMSTTVVSSGTGAKAQKLNTAAGAALKGHTQVVAEHRG